MQVNTTSTENPKELHYTLQETEEEPFHCLSQRGQKSILSLSRQTGKWAQSLPFIERTIPKKCSLSAERHPQNTRQGVWKGKQEKEPWSSQSRKLFQPSATNLLKIFFMCLRTAAEATDLRWFFTTTTGTRQDHTVRGDPKWVPNKCGERAQGDQWKKQE